MCNACGQEQKLRCVCVCVCFAEWLSMADATTHHVKDPSRMASEAFWAATPTRKQSINKPI